MTAIDAGSTREAAGDRVGRNHRILIVDDNPEIHVDFRKVLAARTQDPVLEQMEEAFFGAPVRGMSSMSTQTYDIDSAFQGQEALGKVQAALIRGEPYALAFVDMRMPPGWDGVETIAKLWEADPELQIVICSAYSDYSWEEILKRLGASDSLLILKKPFDGVEVCQLACALTEKWRLSRRSRVKLSRLDGVVAEQTRELEQGSQRLQVAIAQRSTVEAALRDSEARYERAAASANDGLWDWDLAAGTVYFSARWKGILGFTDDEIGAAPDEWLGRVHPGDLGTLRACLDEHVAGKTAHVEIEYRIRHRDGQYRWMLCRGLAVRDGGGAAIRLAGSQTDVTDRRLAEERLRHDAFHDALTGLANRTMLLDRLRHCLLRSKRNPEYLFAVLFADLDRFKLINDSLGHAAGDELLVGISRRLLQSIRATDSMAQLEQGDVSRLGGDEFVVLLDGVRSETDVLRVASRLQEALAEPFIIDGKEVFTGMSIGIALGRSDYDKPEDILRDADTALYQGKSNARGSCELFDATMHASAMSRWWIENALRRAAERGELRLCYQPIVSVRTGELRELEALIRWQHPTRGAISPAEFIPVAEETGLIAPLGEWVMKTAASQIKAWEAAFEASPHLSVAINVSGKQLSRAGLGERVASILADRGVPARRVRLEVTESALMEKGLSQSMLAHLTDLDLKLHLDDFGTGYSSLAYLHKLPVDALKIDRSFINDMMKDATSASIVESIIALAHTLGAQVIAEGVETAEQLERLRRLDCDLAQGYYFSRPLEVDKVTALIAPPAPAAEPVVMASRPTP